MGIIDQVEEAVIMAAASPNIKSKSERYATSRIKAVALEALRAVRNASNEDELTIELDAQLKTAALIFMLVMDDKGFDALIERFKYHLLTATALYKHYRKSAGLSK